MIRRRRPSAIDFVRIDSEAFHQGFSLLAEDLQYDRSHWARPEQRLPDGDWINWLILAGRGYGKTRGAETVRQWVKRYQYVNLIGATADDVRDIMITGESGILAVCPKDARPRYIANKRMLAWPNGAISLLFTAEEPDRFRGKQHMKLWLDELAAWRYGQESWDQASLGLRLGDRPQAVITTTPRPIKIIKDLIADPTTKVTRGSTYDNVANLADAFIKTIVKRYEGARLGRQELNAEILDDVDGALWTRAVLDSGSLLAWRMTRRFRPPPKLRSSSRPLLCSRLGPAKPSPLKSLCYLARLPSWRTTPS